MASQAGRGMRELQKPIKLKALDQDHIRAIGEKLRGIHAKAYAWSPPATEIDGEFLTSGRTRTYVRALINQLDLARLYPAYQTDLEAQELQPSHTEDKHLEAASDAGENGSE